MGECIFTNWYIHDPWRPNEKRFIVAFGIKVFLRLVAYSHSNIEKVCFIYLFLQKQRKCIMQFLFSADNRHVLHFCITVIIMKEVFLIFRSMLTIYWILKATLLVPLIPCNLQKLVPAILVFLFLLPFLHLLIRYCRLPSASAWELFT